MKYVCRLMATDPIFRFFLKKPRVLLLALVQISLMWLSHIKPLVVVTPRYLAEVNSSRLYSHWRQSITEEEEEEEEEKKKKKKKKKKKEKNFSYRR